MELLHAHQLSLKRTQDIPALSFPDLLVKKGDRLLLLGPSGAGKTTLLSLLAGLIPPTTGRVTVEGQDLYALPSGVRDRLRGRRFGFVFQTLHLLPALTLRRNIMLAAEMTGLKPDETRLRELLPALGLSDKAQRRPHELSQGEQQRAAIARAVFNRPALIIADEPTSALDDANALAVAELLSRQAQDSGAALIVATHDARIRDFFDHVIFLKDIAPRDAREAA